MKVAKIKQGGFSGEVWNQPMLQQYMAGGLCFGWVGGKRTNKQDAQLETALRGHGMGPRAIAIWLTSTSARHLNDNPTLQNIKEYAVKAPRQVVVWEHPEHYGTIGSTHDIAKSLSDTQFKLYLHYIG